MLLLLALCCVYVSLCVQYVCVCVCVYVCVCVAVDIDECREQPRVCGLNGTCRNTHGSYRCSCNTGFHISPAGTCAGISVSLSLSVSVYL